MNYSPFIFVITIMHLTLIGNDERTTLIQERQFDASPVSSTENQDRCSYDNGCAAMTGLIIGGISSGMGGVACFVTPPHYCAHFPFPAETLDAFGGNLLLGPLIFFAGGALVGVSIGYGLARCCR